MSRQLEQLGAMPYAKKLESMEIDEVATIVSYLLAQAKMKIFLDSFKRIRPGGSCSRRYYRCGRG